MSRHNKHDTAEQLKTNKCSILTFQFFNINEFNYVLNNVFVDNVICSLTRNKLFELSSIQSSQQIV